MATQSDAAVEQRRKRVAAEYHRQGYRVIRPDALAPLPSFLGDCRPDLIAEKGDDHVVIEIKPGRALKGSNELKELAARVAGQPGWRFELVALGNEAEEAATVSQPGWLETMLHAADRGAGNAPDVLRFGYLYEVLGYLLRGIASLNHIRARDKSPERIARELAFAGVVDQDMLDRIEAATAGRADR